MDLPYYSLLKPVNSFVYGMMTNEEFINPNEYEFSKVERYTKEEFDSHTHDFFLPVHEEDYKVFIRPFRKDNIEYSSKFPSLLCSNPYRYKIRIDVPNKYGERTFDLYLTSFRDKNERIIENGLFYEHIYLMGLDQTIEHYFKIWFTTTSFKKNRCLFKLNIIDEDSDRLVYSSGKFELVARKNTSYSKSFWNKHRKRRTRQRRKLIL